MFETLVYQYLKKLPKGEVRDLTSPKTFHTRKVQRLGRNKVKSFTKICSKFPMPVSALMGDMSVESRQLIDGTPPVARTFHFTRKAFVETSQPCQRLFQELWRLYFLAIAQCQKSVFHAEVCTYIFTRSGQDFLRRVVGHDIQPICANIVAKDLEITHVSYPIAVLVKGEPTLIKLQSVRGCVPRLERHANTSGFKFVACLELRRTITSFAFELRRTDASSTLTLLQISKKLFPRKVKADNHCVKRVTRYPCPMFMGALEQLRQMWLQPITSRVFTINAVIPLFQRKKVIMHITQVVKHIPQAFILRMLTYRIFIGSQRTYQLPVFNPYTVGRQTRNLAITLCMSANW